MVFDFNFYCVTVKTLYRSTLILLVVHVYCNIAISWAPEGEMEGPRQCGYEQWKRKKKRQGEAHGENEGDYKRP